MDKSSSKSKPDGSSSSAGADAAAAQPELPLETEIPPPPTYIERLDAAFVHVMQCRGNCHQSECLRMKRRWHHNINCERQESEDCRTCSLLRTLLSYHIQNCKPPTCNIRPCMTVKNATVALRSLDADRREKAVRILYRDMALIASESKCRQNDSPTG